MFSIIVVETVGGGGACSERCSVDWVVEKEGEGEGEEGEGAMDAAAEKKHRKCLDTIGR